MSAKSFQNLLDNLLKDAIKIKGKHPPIAKRVGDERKQLDIKKIYQLDTYSRDLYLFKAKNYKKSPKYRYFLVILLARVSSDLLVELAKDFALKHSLQLLQYSLLPKSLRVNLLGLKELENSAEVQKIINLLKNFKILFEKKLKMISNNFTNK
ncbi:MAG: hypothetical protein GF311_09530 [Candidatus Lokiarchaeota archaeon]|nr:hypothetical protein [Candidatus Lokiarchaeota archaeon]